MKLARVYEEFFWKYSLWTCSELLRPTNISEGWQGEMARSTHPSKKPSIAMTASIGPVPQLWVVTSPPAQIDIEKYDGFYSPIE